MKDWLGIAKTILFRPNKFFSRMPTSGGYKEPMMFALVYLIVYGIILGILYSIIFSLADIPLAGLFSIFFFFYGIAAAIGGGLAALFIWGGIMHGLMRLFGGRGTYEGSVRVLSYSGVIALVSWIPLLNLAVMFYAVYLQVVGFSQVHRISRMRTLGAILIPIVLVWALVLAFMNPWEILESIVYGMFNPRIFEPVPA